MIEQVAAQVVENELPKWAYHREFFETAPIVSRPWQSPNGNTFVYVVVRGARVPWRVDDIDYVSAPALPVTVVSAWGDDPAERKEKLRAALKNEAEFWNKYWQDCYKESSGASDGSAIVDGGGW